MTSQSLLVPWWSHTSDFTVTVGTLVATLQGTWRYRVNARTSWPAASILWLRALVDRIYSLCLSLTECETVQTDPFWRYTSMLMLFVVCRLPTKQPASGLSESTGVAVTALKSDSQWGLWCTWESLTCRFTQHSASFSRLSQPSYGMFCLLVA